MSALRSARQCCNFFRYVLACGAFFLCAADKGVVSECAEPISNAENASSLLQVGRAVRGKSMKKLNASGTKDALCQCEADNEQWSLPAPRAPRCIFIDLGAADGNTFQQFLSNGYGSVSNCPSGGAYEAILVEANPIFNDALQKIQSNFPVSVRSFVSSAAYMCEGVTSFYLDTVDVENNYWGSSMSPNARDVQRSGQQAVTVPLVNVIKLIQETAIKDDYVLLKMDIEGAEHDILPCLAKSKAAGLIDALYVEKHPIEWANQAQASESEAAVLSLQQQGVNIPFYESPS